MKKLRLALPFIFVLACFIVFGRWMASLPIDAAARGQLGDSFGVLNSLFSGLGFAAVVLTIWIQQGQIKSQEKERLDEVAERRSLFNLNAAIDATEQAHLLLSDHNNDRKTWIEAARLLGHAKVLGDGVTIDCHKRVLEASRLKYRSFFSELLEHKSAAFFYGVRLDCATTDSAARASSAPSSINGVMSLSEVRQLEEASIYRVWEAAQWPADFEDPVGQTFSPSERSTLRFTATGLREYLEHKEQWSSFGGELHPRTTKRPIAEAN